MDNSLLSVRDINHKYIVVEMRTSMALKVRDIPGLPGLDSLKLISGSGGLDRKVVTAGIADYEFAPNVEFRDTPDFVRDSFVITSLLFAYNNPVIIIDAVKSLYDCGVSAIACKDVIFDKLPDEVLQFSNEHNIPIYSFGKELYFENIIFEVMAALHTNDDAALNTDNIQDMINSYLSAQEVTAICYGISLELKRYITVAYVKYTDDAPMNADRIYMSLSRNRSLKDKILTCGFNNGLFIIITSSKYDISSHEIILKEALESLPVNTDRLAFSLSDVHIAFEHLDLGFKESYYCHCASEAEKKNFRYYSDIGIYKLITPLIKTPYVLKFSEDYLRSIKDRPEYYSTVLSYSRNHGDFTAVSAEMNCHANTIRYRISKAKALSGQPDIPDTEFYRNASIAIAIDNIKKFFV